MHSIPTLRHATGLILVALTLLAVRTASADDLTSDSRRARQQLVAQNPAAAKANSKALAVLVFPNVVKAGFVFGAQGGKGILFMHGQPSGRYRTVAASYGLQAGVQKYGYALFFMNQKAVDWINTTRGWAQDPSHENKIVFLRVRAVRSREPDAGRSGGTGIKGNGAGANDH